MRLCRSEAELHTLHLQSTSKVQNVTSRDCAVERLEQLSEVSANGNIFPHWHLILKVLKHTFFTTVSFNPKFAMQWTVCLTPTLTLLCTTSCQSWRKTTTWWWMDYPKPVKRLNFSHIIISNVCGSTRITIHKKSDWTEFPFNPWNQNSHIPGLSFPLAMDTVGSTEKSQG